MPDDSNNQRPAQKAAREDIALVCTVASLALLPLFLAAAAVWNDHTAFALACFSTAIAMMFVMFDWLVINAGPRTNKDGDSDKMKYYPNFRIWGAGLILGIGVNIAYLFSRVILSSIEHASVEHQAISNFSNPSLVFSDAAARREIIEQLSTATMWHECALLVVLAAALGLLVWGIVRVFQSE